MQIESAYGPWNPGIRSPLRRELRPLATIYRAENVFTTALYAEELSDLTGLDPTELVAFRPQRLALHELLVRITADLSVPDGQRIEDLGINFREMTRVILGRYIEPRMPAIIAAYDALRTEITSRIAREVDSLFMPPVASTPPPPKTGWRLLFARRREVVTGSHDDINAGLEMIGRWRRMAEMDDVMQRSIGTALAKVASALFARHGTVWGDRALIAALAVDIACNQAAGEAIGQLIDPLIATAANDQGYRLLPSQERPVVMNTKGPSASGKSTIRPLQRALAGYIGVTWSEFALISPDIWRKQLIDYASLGPHYKYGGAFTGDELAIIDGKLDRYIARKAERGIVPHLLIDRFRFDSFAPHSDEPGSNLLTRFGHVVYLFFLITPPASIVERAWKRGLEVGRYKTVDDLLAHAVEAYSGMPPLFFTWVQHADKRVHFEFLDNSVPFGERPRTVAFGWNDTLNVLDIKCLLDINRYRRVNVDATSADELYRDTSQLAAEHNAAFLRECIERFPEVNFADATTGRIYLRMARGTPVWADAVAMRAIDAEAQAGLAAVAPALFDNLPPPPGQETFVAAAEKIHTLGTWGPSTAMATS
ncbi:MAG TPA: hypothetical protein VNG69_02620 [Casimicrobiaceae bacterium]|nr:hypothetical protein [Casimicrobiaceae bacterium]